MPFFLITFFVFALVLTKQPRDRAVLVINTLLIYILLIILEQIYLETYFNRSFEFSDPSKYLGLTSHLSLDGLIGFLSGDDYISNRFYYIVNWIYYNTLFLSEAATGIFLKATNAIYFLFAYLLLKSRSSERSGVMDGVILFHPWLLFVVIRNVRDIYIIFLLALVVYAILKIRLRMIDYVTCAFSIISMYFIRSFFVVPMVLALLLRLWDLWTLRKRAVLVIMTILFISIAGYMYKDQLVLTAVNGFLGNAVYFGGEDQQVVDDLKNEVIASGAVSADFTSLLMKKLIFAVPVFLFTPHPYNWTSKYVEQRQGGVYGIYTDVDNALIILGAVLNYLFIYPLMFKYAHCWRQINIKLIAIPFFIMAFYSIFLLGNADMRIRYTFIFFMVFGFYRCGLTLYGSRKDLKYFLLSLAVLLVIPMISG